MDSISSGEEPQNHMTKAVVLDWKIAPEIHVTSLEPVNVSL